MSSEDGDLVACVESGDRLGAFVEKWRQIGGFCREVETGRGLLKRSEDR